MIRVSNRSVGLLRPPGIWRAFLALVVFVWACALEGIASQEAYASLGRAAYVGGTLPRFIKRIEGGLSGYRDHLVFGIREAELLISVKNIRSAEYGPQPGRRARGVAIHRPSSVGHYLTLVYTDPLGKEQVVVFDLAQEAVQGTLKFIGDQSWRAIDYQLDQGKSPSLR